MQVKISVHTSSDKRVLSITTTGRADALIVFEA